jgi:hypothetical protein
MKRGDPVCLLAKGRHRYFSHNPLPLVRYIEILLLLMLVCNFQKFGILLALVRYSALPTFFPQWATTSPQFLYSATAIFTAVHCY